MGAETGPIRDRDDVYRPLSVLMQACIETIEPGHTLRAAHQMTENRRGSLLVRQMGNVVGRVTETDLVRNGLAENTAVPSTRIGSVITEPVTEVEINWTVDDASDLMAGRGGCHVGVTEHWKIVGIVAVRDLSRMISVRDRPRFGRGGGT